MKLLHRICYTTEPHPKLTASQRRLRRWV